MNYNLYMEFTRDTRRCAKEMGRMEHVTDVNENLIEQDG